MLELNPRQYDLNRLTGHIHGKDIPLVGSAFTPEQQNELLSKGYNVYKLTGRSLSSLKNAGYPFWSTWWKEEPFAHLGSLHSEVAINPTKLFLPGSNNTTFDRATAMVEQFGKQVGREIPGTTAILGSAADYAELAFAHLSNTGQRLFGKDFGCNFTRTTTSARGLSLAIFGSFHHRIGPAVGEQLQYSHELVWVAPLVVPAAVGNR